MEYQIINFVRLNSVLYDKSNKLYKNITYRNEKWNLLADIINVDVNKIKKRWKTLRDAYMREKKKYKTAFENYDGIPARKSKYFDNLNFLDYSTVQESNESLDNINLMLQKKLRRGCTEHVWSAEETVKLISLFEKYTDLWDPSSPNYRKRTKRPKLIKEISSEMGLSAEDVGGKIHNLRCQYYGELRKLEMRKCNTAKNKVLGRVYKLKRDQKEKLHNEIGNVSGVSAEDVASKIHNLRSKYKGVLRKSKKIKKSRKIKIKKISNDDNKVYESRWEYFNSLNFLRRTTSNVDSQNSSKLPKTKYDKICTKSIAEIQDKECIRDCLCNKNEYTTKNLTQIEDNEIENCIDAFVLFKDI